MLFDPRNLRSWLIVVAILLGLTGLTACGGSESEATAGETPVGSNAGSEAGTSDDTDSSTDSGAPDALFHALAQSVKKSDPTIAWNALPASYRKDVEGLVHTFAAKMDPTVWDKGMGILSKLGRTLDEKGEFLAANPMIAGMLQNSGITPEQMKEQLDGTAKGLKALTSGSLASLEEMKTVDVASMLTTDVAAAMKSLQGGLSQYVSSMNGPTVEEQLASMKTTIVKQDADRATVRVETVGEEPEENEMMKVEGVWVPVEVGEEWATRISEAREAIQEMEMTPQMKGQAMMSLGMAEGILDQLLAAETQAQFDQAVAGIFGMLGPMMGGAGRPDGGMPGGAMPPRMPGGGPGGGR